MELTSLSSLLLVMLSSTRRGVVVGFSLSPLQQQQQSPRVQQQSRLYVDASSSGSSSSGGGGMFYNDFEGYDTDSTAAASSNSNSDKGPEEEAEEKDDPDDLWAMLNANQRLGDWRAFRRNLVTNGANSHTKWSSSRAATTTTASTSKSRGVLGCTKNLIVLEKQNAQLAQEYKTQLWAHEIATPEVGALLLRMPLEAELVHQVQAFHPKQSLSARSLTAMRFRQYLMNQHVGNAGSDYNALKREVLSDVHVWYHTAQEWIQEEMSEIAALATTTSSSGIGFGSTSDEAEEEEEEDDDDEYDDEDDDDDEDDTDTPLSLLSSATSRSSSSSRKDNKSKSSSSTGIVDASVLSSDKVELLQVYLEHQKQWQQVCLILEHDVDNKSSTCLVLNRPMATRVNRHLASLLLHGAYHSTWTSSSSAAARGGSNKSNNKNDTVQHFLRAFGSSCAVYLGGPHDQELPATLLHGHGDIPQATLVAPGIYQGGSVRHVVDGILNGHYKALDFKWFVGRHVFGRRRVTSTTLDYDDDDDDSSSGYDDYDDDDELTILPGSESRASTAAAAATTLDLSIVLGKHQAIASSRCLVLKQSIGLPTPLWHEVMEICGNTTGGGGASSDNSDLATLSKLELERRFSVQFQIVEEGDDDDDDDDDDDMDDDDDDDDFFMIDELDELDRLDEEDDDDYYSV